MAASSLVIGIMSGTSLDGIDAVLADYGQSPPQSLGHVHLGFDPELKEELLALNRPGTNELERAALVGNRLAEHYAQAVHHLLRQTGLAPAAIAAIGCHGQTVRHRPELGYTVQLNNPARLAERTGIAVVADFRSRDVAAGGQGAPLVPAFHAAVFSHPSRHRVIINIGGIANLTDLPPGGPVTGFDCGPGNLLLDAWCQRHCGQPYDEGGRWAASGRPIPELLADLLTDPFFGEPPPKSTGRDLFHLGWLEPRLKPDYAPADVQATLLRLTVHGIREAVRRFAGGVEEGWLCGGGARNTALVNTLRHAFADTATPVALTDALGVPAEWVEALAFGWLAWRTLQGAPGNLPAVTGAAHACVLGAIYPA